MNSLKSRKTITQFASLLFSNYSLVIITFVTSILMTRSMHESQYGYYKYAISIITMSVTFINGGFHFSAARLIAVSEKSKENSILSITTLSMLIIATLFAGISSIIIFIVNKTVVDVDPIFFWAFPMVFTLLLQRTFITVLKGNNKINDIILQTIFPQLLILVIYFIVSLKGLRLDFKDSLIIYGLVYLSVHLITWKRLKLKIPSNLKENFKLLCAENKRNGFQLYKGAIAGVMIGEILTVIVGGTIEKSIFGMYSLAISMSAPINTIPHAMATIKYRENSRLKKMSKKNIITTVSVSILGLIALNLGVRGLFPYFFESRYDGALNFLLLCSLTFLIHGLGDYFNQFLASHGLGIYLRNGAYISGGVQLISAIAFVPKFGIYGLIFSKLAASSAYLFSMVFIYYKYTTTKYSRKGEV